MLLQILHCICIRKMTGFHRNTQRHQDRSWHLSHRLEALICLSLEHHRPWVQALAAEKVSKQTSGSPNGNLKEGS